MDIKELTEYVRQNAILVERISELSAIQSDLKNNIREGVKELGVESDKGHIVVELNDEVSGVRNAMQQKKVSKNLDMAVAEELLKSKGIYDRCVELVPQLNEQQIIEAYWEELITEEDLDTMFPSKVVWALVVK
jgi:REP element-mobilizing transposase RayT